MKFLREIYAKWRADREAKEVELAVGRIAVEWSRLEYATNQLFVEMLHMEDATRARIIGNEMGHRNKLAAIRALAIRIMPQKEAAQVVKIVNFIDGDLRVCRNNYVHGIFKGVPDNRALYHKTRISKPASFELKVDVEKEVIGMIDVAYLPRSAIRDSFVAILFLAMHFTDEPEPGESSTWLSLAVDNVEYAKKFMDEYKAASRPEDEK